MNLFAAGVNHVSAPVEVREKLARGLQDLHGALAELRAFAEEGVLVSTCNRVEVYAQAEGRESVRDEATRLLAERSDLSEEELGGLMYEFRGRDAARHLFKVAAGIDSMVRGETQILSQMKDAYTQAAEEGMTGPVLNPLFQAAFRAAKVIHTDSGIGRRKVSVGSVAVDLAEKALGGLNDKRVLIVGAGKMSELTLRHLAAKGVRSIIVANRTHEKARELAEKFNGEAVSFEALDDELARADIVLASSSAPHYVVRAETVRAAMTRRKGRPLFFIDIAVPRDVEPEAATIENVFIYDIDGLQMAAGENLAQREQEVTRCLKMIDEAAGEYWEEASRTDAAPLIRGITERLHRMRREELARGRLSRMSAEHLREVERLTERLVNRILHEPLKAIRAEAGKKKGARAGGLLEALHRLFNMPSPGTDAPPEKD